MRAASPAVLWTTSALAENPLRVMTGTSTATMLIPTKIPTIEMQAETTETETDPTTIMTSRMWMQIDGETAPYTTTFLARHAGSSTTPTKDAIFYAIKTCIHSSTSIARWISDNLAWESITPAAQDAYLSSQMMVSPQESINDRMGDARWNRRKHLWL